LAVAAALVAGAGLTTFGALETTRASVHAEPPLPAPSVAPALASEPPPSPSALAPFAPPLRMSAPAASARPREGACDVPAAIDLWRTCDPIPRTHDAWDEALASGRAGMLELGSKPRARLRIDGRNYGIYVGGDARVTRLPVSPGAHVLDFIDDAHVAAVRRTVDVRAGETKRIVLELRERLPAPLDPERGG
jgi:hypothetical protein